MNSLCVTLWGRRGHFITLCNFYTVKPVEITLPGGKYDPLVWLIPMPKVYDVICITSSFFYPAVLHSV